MKLAIFIDPKQVAQSKVVHTDQALSPKGRVEYLDKFSQQL